MYKLIFYVPSMDKENVKNAIFKTGAGRIGHYSHCAWEVEGMGQFLPLQGANPHLGKIEQLERVKEYRVEVLCEEDQLRPALAALKSSHPYEEPAYEIVSVLNHKF
ncbi:MAG: NGG1p interacting factor NIF3 [Halobacteriovoraceae bacterium]|nr:NGG1p interacting factor NIF3 [Halobacteriovoraceae bacterium]